jgi:hypothetical protein
MNRATFYARLRSRASGIFGTSLSQRQVDGIEALLNAGEGLPLHHMANVLAQVYHETGGGMYPIKETVFRSHKNQNPSDAEVIRRLDVAFSKGQLPWVRTPYWRDGWFGRGQIQITHKANYDKFGVSKAQALEPKTSARIAVQGMRDGMFRGHKLADYDFPAALRNPPATNPRRIVNGSDGTDQKVGGYHLAFADALQAGGWAAKASFPKPAPSERQGFFAWLLNLILRRE